MNSVKDAMLLYAVTGNYDTAESLYIKVEEALKGGITCLQFREKDRDREDLIPTAISIGKLCKEYGVPFIINDYADIAIKTDADGVHIGQSDMNGEDVRSAIGKGKILGISVQTVEQAIKAEADGADYLGVGAIFPTNTKDDADSVEYDTLKSICNAVSIPVVAIGGISESNIEKLGGSGIDGVAVVSALFSADSTEASAKLLLKKSKECFCL